MENKSNYLLVGTMVLALLVAIAIFIVWMARVSGSDRKEYDIFFKQAVSGLARGSGVAFRSEEHTSELQSLMRISYAVFCLTKKKPTITTPQLHSTNLP